MDERTKIHVGLDAHKDSISVAAAEPGRAPGRLIGKVVHDVNKLLKVLAKIGTAEQLHAVYEAGPTGFGLQRALPAKGYTCEIVAPSLIPRRPGDRVKTDGRDSGVTRGAGRGAVADHGQRLLRFFSQANVIACGNAGVEPLLALKRESHHARAGALRILPVYLTSWRSKKLLSWCRACVRLLTASSRARDRSRIASSSGSGIQMALNCPARGHSANCTRFAPAWVRLRACRWMLGSHAG